MNTILIFYFAKENRVRVVYKQGNEEKGMEGFTNAYITHGKNGQIHIKSELTDEHALPLLTVPVSRTIIRYQ